MSFYTATAEASTGLCKHGKLTMNTLLFSTMLKSSQSRRLERASERAAPAVCQLVSSRSFAFTPRRPAVLPLDAMGMDAA